VLGLEGAECEALLASADSIVDGAHDLHQFTSQLNRSLSHEEKLQLLEQLWRVAQADAIVHHYEEHLIRRVADLLHVSHREFIERAYAPNRPIVVTDMMRDWKAVTRWTWPFLKRTVGAAEVQVMEARETTRHYDLNVERISEATTLGEFIGWIERVKRSNARYMVARNNGLTAPGLRPLVGDLGFFSGILNRRLLDGFVYLWVGPGSTVTPLHHDTANNLFCQVRGRKRFILIDPANAELLRDVLSYYSLIDAERFDEQRFPYLAEIDRMTVTVGPGEALFIPSGWWHHVRALSPSISVSMTNFTKLLDTDDPSYPVPGRR
jgi:hypothetical protein